MSVLLALGIFLFSASVFSLPLCMHLHTLIPGGLEDTQLFLWNAWWARHVWTHPPLPLYQTMELFYPYGVSLITHDMPLWMTFVTDAVQAAHCSLLTSVNVWFIGTWALNGFCTYLLAKDVVGYRAPAYVAGLFVMTHAYTLARAMENWGQFNLYGLALFLWLLIRARKHPQSVALCLSAGFAFAWTAACHYYFFIYALLVWTAVVFLDHSPWSIQLERCAPRRLWRCLGATCIVSGGGVAAWILLFKPGILTVDHMLIGLESPANALLVFWLGLGFWMTATWTLSVRQRSRTWRRTWEQSPHRMMACSAFIFLVPLLWKAVPVMVHGDYPRQHVLWKTHLPGANLLALFSPNPLQRFWGASVSAWFTRVGLDPQEEASMIGWICLLVVGWSQVWRANLRSLRWLSLALTATILSMGVYLTIGSINLWCPLPFYLTRLLPLLENVRVPERWMALGAVAWAVVLAAALVRLAEKKAWALNRLCVVVGMLILIENWPGIPLVPPPALSLLYQRLKAQPAGAVLPVPFYAGDSSIGEGDMQPSAHNFPWEHLWAQTQHEKPIVGGYIGRVPRRLLNAYAQDPYWGRLIQLEEGHDSAQADPTQEQIHQAVQQQGIRYCLLYPTAVRPSVLAFVRRTLSLEWIASDGDRELYRIKD